MKILVIGDSHLEANSSLERYEWLGKFIVEEKPEVIVQIGDFVSMDCLSHWDYNHRAKMEGRRYQDEVRIAKEALRLMEHPMEVANKYSRESKKKLYHPRKIWHEGNHEDRLRKYLEDRPELIGSFNLSEEIGAVKRKWEIVPYKEYSKVKDLLFTHVPFNNANQPISGKFICDKALVTHDRNVIFGHSHRLELSTDARHVSLKEFLLMQ